MSVSKQPFLAFLFIFELDGGAALHLGLHLIIYNKPS